MKYHSNAIFMVLIIALFGCTSEKTTPAVAVKAEVAVFMDHYAELLRKRDLEGIAGLYDERGIVLSGHGTSDFTSYDSIRAIYQKQSKEPIDFRWSGTNIDSLSSNLALVTARFYWNDTTTAISYTGLLFRTEKGWKIRHEHESAPCR